MRVDESNDLIQIIYDENPFVDNEYGFEIYEGELKDDNAVLTDDDDDASHGNGDLFNADDLGNSFPEDFKEFLQILSIPGQNEIIPEQNDDVFLETAFYTDSARKVFEQSNVTINELREMEKRGDVKRTGGRGKDFKGTKFIIKNIETAKKLKKEKMRSKEAKMWKEGDAKLQNVWAEESIKICFDTFVKYHDDHDRIAKIGLALGGKRSRRKF